eukprot:c3375_g1_i2.p1 GENE.c3375_g1_i2~~c3375_g1_i2.p1  ORF type:complete len:111 (-),score=12.20 c3375_g1_i2:172-504(-)
MHSAQNRYSAPFLDCARSTQMSPVHSNKSASLVPCRQWLQTRTFSVVAFTSLLAADEDCDDLLVGFTRVFFFCRVCECAAALSTFGCDRSCDLSQKCVALTGNRSSPLKL